MTIAERHPDRRAQAQALGARAVTELDSHELVFEAVGRPETWRAAVEAAAPGGTVVLVGGCPLGTEASLPAAPLHYDELDLRGTFHHSPAEVDEALAALSAGVVDWRALAGETIGLEQLPDALAAPPGRARQMGGRPTRCEHSLRGTCSGATRCQFPPQSQSGTAVRAACSDRRHRRCSTIRFESQIASPSSTSTGTRR